MRLAVKKYANSSQYKLLVIDNGSRQTVYEDVKSYLDDKKGNENLRCYLQII